ncbi:hypothetical protein [Sulfitobacter sediminilitoris]|uniref:hypothetical protein n=1 Tax=Sulfitobacter sediminilitoris TaxID=2698830 RepID=UPI00360A0FDF
MRYAAIFSLLLAAVLASAAVYGARTWLLSERQQLVDVLEEEEKRQGEAPRDTIVVAAEQIQFGERIVQTALMEIEWSGAIRPEGSYAQISDLIIGDTDETVRFAVTPMAVGEPVLSSKVTEPGQRAKLSTALAQGKKLFPFV